MTKLKEIKSTPGPWHLNSNGGIQNKPLHDKFYSDYICQMPFATNQEMKEIPEAEANAKLIVAAPELLEICKKVLIAIEGSNDQLERMLKQIIKKAEGR